MSSAKQDPKGDQVIVGKIVGLYGIHGWVKVFSHTDPKENIFSYAPWLVQAEGQWRPVKVLSGRTQGKGLVAQLEGCGDREQARLFIGAEIAVLRNQLPKPAAGEYYWADLMGLEVVTLDGQVLGKVEHLFDTGANDVLVVKGERERLIPFVRGQYVHEIDLDGGTMRVDWDPEF
jgi:16S rRNA processing protein RimM